MEQQTTEAYNFLVNLFESSKALFISYGLSVVGAVAILIVGWIVAGVLSRTTLNALKRVERVDLAVAGFFATAVRWGILVIVIVMVLGQFGVQTTSIVAALGAAGLAIGLALQGTLQNVAAGIMLLVLKPFRLGDFVDTGSIAGTIEDIGLFATRMKKIDGLYLLVPNTLLWNVPITNYSRNTLRRYDLTIGIGYEDDISKAEQIMLDLAGADERILKDPEPGTFVAELGDSAVSVTLRYWTASSDFWMTSREMTKKAKVAFDENGINIPYPQVTYSGNFAPPEDTETKD
ncbi:mechanosensitive ion channel family protein [Rhizobium sp. L1K21]|uniref:mechanosensitive ion channel family protein n=1 Tax=Rhizobium sp. L1K21 TaxID=2954933 RepID=UPI002092B93A|nr:mechanosensitive ion channel domain-containing protein [Rhizobium sp. L1K21]MCO6185589.1 mechanosensitive ion channel [Rhizobium sp. L1K21]